MGHECPVVGGDLEASRSRGLAAAARDRQKISNVRGLPSGGWWTRGGEARPAKREDVMPEKRRKRSRCPGPFRPNCPHCGEPLEWGSHVLCPGAPDFIGLCECGRHPAEHSPEDHAPMVLFPVPVLACSLNWPWSGPGPRRIILALAPPGKRRANQRESWSHSSCTGIEAAAQPRPPRSRCSRSSR